MLKAEFLTLREKPIGFHCKGHAGYDAYGKDIVCAAASFLSITCANALEEIARAQLKEERVNEKNGDLLVVLKEGNSKTDTILETWKLGMTQLASEYPDLVKINERSMEEE